jgi:iron complex transport system substrate-binding protein
MENMNLRMGIILLAILAISHVGWAASPGDQNANDYTLGIFGNANLDATIDKIDVSYVEGIINGSNTNTRLSDANYDGKIDESDIDQIESIIRGEEKTLTVIDSANRATTIKLPINRILSDTTYATETIRSLKAKDKIVGISDKVSQESDYFSELKDLPSVGNYDEPDYEAALSMNPDLIICRSNMASGYSDHLPAVPVLGLNFYRAETYTNETKLLGYVLNKNEQADQLIEFIDGVLKKVDEKVAHIPEEKMPKVYLEYYRKYYSAGNGSSYDGKLKKAGASNVFGDVTAGHIDVDPEKVIERDPGIIICGVSIYGKISSDSKETPLTGTNSTSLIGARDEILNRTELGQVSAIKDKRVYVIFGDLFSGLRGNFIGVEYLAKWFYPDLFADLNPAETNKIYLSQFQGLPEDFLETHGLFIYPPQDR